MAGTHEHRGELSYCSPTRTWPSQRFLLKGIYSKGRRLEKYDIIVMTVKLREAESELK